MSELKFDAITGQLTLESLDEATKEQIELTIAQAKDVENMKSAPGYKLLDKFLTENISYFTSKMLNCEAMKDVIRCQEIVKSCQMVLNWVDKHIEIARQLQEQQALEKQVSE